VFVLGNILIGLGMALYYTLAAYMWVLIGRAIISWVNADPRNQIVRFLIMATEPVVERVRRWLPLRLRYYPLDIAFLLVLGLVIFMQFAVANTLVQLGVRLGGRLFT